MKTNMTAELLSVLIGIEVVTVSGLGKECPIQVKHGSIMFHYNIGESNITIRDSRSVNDIIALCKNYAKEKGYFMTSGYCSKNILNHICNCNVYTDENIYSSTFADTEHEAVFESMIKLIKV